MTGPIAHECLSDDVVWLTAKVLATTTPISALGNTPYVVACEVQSSDSLVAGAQSLASR
jgi:hypothetical protein